ncbi:MAG: ABC transporter ATP-binding protein [Microscillaceae bacterium]|nr:ABC transporter ATP-binding protein [Microscillaceae bacterium]
MFQISELHKSYGKKPILKGVDLVVDTGTVQALLGANGAGKSTLIHCISFLIPFEKGEVFIDDEKITFKSNTYRSKVGYILEKPIYIDKFSAREYLHFVADLYKISKQDAKLRVSELLQFLDLPQDDNKYIESYSKGMKNKVSLAAALIHKPSYLILDEPFDGMDFMSVRKISKLLKDMAAKGATILVTSHQFDVIADIADKFALLKEGKIFFNLTMDALSAKASEKFSEDKTPLKSYLESVMSEEGNNNQLSWIS